MQVVLVSFRPEGDRRSFSVVRDITVIGRREDCDLRIPVSEVSRKHCRIIKDGGQLRVEDLGSSNGTYHNGQRVQGGTVLKPGDSVQVGPVVFVVQIDGLPPEDELAPFADRAAHHLDDSISTGATAAALHPTEPGIDEVEENLEHLGETPAESEEIETLEFEDHDDERSIAPAPLMNDEADKHIVAMDMHIPGGGSIPLDLDEPVDKLEGIPAEDEHALPAPAAAASSAPIPFDFEEEAPSEPAPAADTEDGEEAAAIDGDLDFDLMEEVESEPEASEPIALEEEDHLEIPLALHDEAEHDDPPKPKSR